MKFEYKVVPAPTRGKKARGVKTAADRFAHALAEVMNELAAEGWEYLRTDTLPSEERHGLTGRSTVFQNMLVFRRPVEAGAVMPAGDAADFAATDAPNIFIDTSVGHHAPKLPAADRAIVVTNTGPAPKLGAAGRNVAAE